MEALLNQRLSPSPAGSHYSLDPDVYVHHLPLWKFGQGQVWYCLLCPWHSLGGMLALNVRGMTLNVSSAVGFIAMFGLSIQNGIIMVSQINGLRRTGMELRQSVVEGARQRFRPILMTSVTTILGLFPASMATGIGSDVQRPIKRSLFYGLMFDDNCFHVCDSGVLLLSSKTVF